MRAVAQTALFPSRCGVREVWANRPPGCGVPWKIAQLGKCVRATPRQAAGRVAPGSADLSLGFDLTEKRTLAPIPHQKAHSVCEQSRRLRTAGYKDHDSTFCRPRSKPHRPVMHGAPTTRAPCQSLAQDHGQPSSAMRLRMDSLPSMCIILELYTTRSMTASASAPSPMRSCQPDGPYCEQSISDPLR